MVHVLSISLIIASVFNLMNSLESLYDEDLYESVLNNETCRRNLKEMDFLPFLDAGGRIPQSITLGSQGSLGNYQQCLSISQQTPNDTIYGKYCIVQIPLDQSGLKPGANFEFNGTVFELINMSDNYTESMKGSLQFINALGIIIGNGNTRGIPLIRSTGLAVKVAVCLPRSCSTKQAFGQYMDILHVSHHELYCRLPDDKIFSTVDYAAVIIIIILGALTALSTSYDLYYDFVLNKDERNKLLTSFSIYTNTRRLFNFPKTAGSIDCLDGIRALSILWVVIGHSFVNLFFGITINLLTAFQWASSSSAIWLISAVLSVDTFFMMSGLLVVYTTVKKMTPMKLVKNIHLFYLHRLLRMFPLLAVVVLFQASLLHHSADGPGWPALAAGVRNCRKWWWSALLHVQNYVNISEIQKKLEREFRLYLNCNLLFRASLFHHSADGPSWPAGCLSHTWYLSVDIQLHIIAPLVLFWVLRSRRSAWLALAAGTLASVVITTTYCYVKDFPGSSILSMNTDWSALLDYFKYYYVNTLTRSPPFFVGMVLGYLLHIWRESPKRIPKWLILTGWLAALVLGSGMVYCNYLPVVSDIDRFWSNFLNSFMRAFWALAVGWVVFACASGYGGPVNWFLSLKMWKFLARISYSLYLIHFPIQLIIRGQSEMPFMFSPRGLFYMFFCDLALSLTVATALCVLVDAPFSTLQKIALRGKPTSAAIPPSNGASSSTENLVN